MILRNPSGVPGIEYFVNPPKSVYDRFDTEFNIDPLSTDLSKYNMSPPPLRELAQRAARRKSGLPASSTRPASAKKAPHTFQTVSEKTQAEGGETEELVGNENDFARQSIHMPARRETQHWGQLSDLIRSEQLAVKVFFPDRKPIEVQVEPTAMATDVVVAALAAHKKRALLGESQASGGVPLDYDRPELYCLMMHDGDGMPDDMAVPGDRSLGDLNETEVVIVPKVFRSVTADSDFGQDDDDAFDSDDGAPYTPQEGRSGRAFSVTPLKEMGDDPVSGWSRRNSTTAHPELVTVTLPDASECKVLLQGHWRASDLIAEVSLKRKHRIAVLSREYELHVLWLDQDRLHWANTVVDPDVLLVGLQVTELELKPRTYMDQPRIKMPGTRNTNQEAIFNPRMGPNSDNSSMSSVPGGGGGGGGGAPPPPTQANTGFSGKCAEEVYELMYVVQTAEMLEEWDIVKTNRWGKRQKRVIGIGKDTYDQEYKIYNKKRDDVNKSRITDSVQRSARLLKQVLGVKQMIPDKPRFFTITYRDEKEKPQDVVFEVPLSSDAPKREGFKNEGVGDKVKEQEKEAAEQCLRIVAKLLFLLDLQRQRSQRQKSGRSGTVEADNRSSANKSGQSGDGK